MHFYRCRRFIPLKVHDKLALNIDEPLALLLETYPGHRHVLTLVRALVILLGMCLSFENNLITDDNILIVPSTTIQHHYSNTSVLTWHSVWWFLGKVSWEGFWLYFFYLNKHDSKKDWNLLNTFTEYADKLCLGTKRMSFIIPCSGFVVNRYLTVWQMIGPTSLIT